MAYSFVGTNNADVINFGAPPKAANLSTVTVFARVKITAYANYHARIIDKLVFQTSGWTFRTTATNTSLANSFNFGAGFPSQELLAPAPDNSLPATPTAYMALAATWNGGASANNVGLFYNTTQITPDSGKWLDGVGTIGVDAQAICVGNNPGGNRGFSGVIAEAAVWSAILNSQEIASLVKGFKPHRIRPQSLTFYAPMVRTCNDSVNANPGTVTGATVTDHPRVY